MYQVSRYIIVDVPVSVSLIVWYINNVSISWIVDIFLLILATVSADCNQVRMNCTADIGSDN